MRNAVVLSLVVHVAVLVAARPIAARLALAAEPAALDAPADVWAGNSVEIQTTADGPGEPAGGQAGAEPAAAKTANDEADDKPDDGDEPAKSAPAKSAGPVTAPATTASAVPSARPSGSARKPAPSASPEPEPPAKKQRQRLHRPPVGKGPRGQRPSGAASGAPGAGAAGDGPGGGSFGSAGQAAVRDLGRAFTRAIPAACSADPIWGEVEAGDAGTLRVDLHINADGRITGAEPVGDTPPKALANLLRRTLPLLQAGTFAIRAGAVTAGTETLEIKAKVVEGGAAGDDDGGRENLAFAYDGGRGRASFTRPGGRRVELTIRLVKTDVVAPASPDAPSGSSAPATSSGPSGSSPPATSSAPSGSTSPVKSASPAASSPSAPSPPATKP